MHVYFIGTIASMLFAALAEKIRKSDTNFDYSLRGKLSYYFFYVLSILPLLIISSIRKDVGTDYGVYSRRFTAILHGERSNDNVEIGYKLIVKFLGLFTDNIQWLFVVTALLFIVFIYRSIYDQSKNICFSILLLLITTTFSRSLNTMRQIIAMSMFLYSVKYIYTNNLKRYCVVMFFASLIHTTALLYMPFYFIKYIKLNKIVIGSTIVGAVVLQNVFRNIVEFIAVLTGYGNYLNSVFDGGGIDKMIFITNVAVIMLIFISKEDSNSNQYIVYRNIQIVAFLCSAWSRFIPNSSRIIFMFMPVQILLVPYLIKQYDNKYIRMILYYLFTLLYLALLFDQIYTRNYGQTLPYMTIFSESLF